MEKELLLKTSVTINAPKANVWDAFTNPEQIKKYLFGTEAVSDWKVGSTLVFKGVWDGKAYEDKGYILELEKEKKFKYSYWSSFSGTEDIAENYSHVTYEISEEGGKTLFILTQDGFKTKEAMEHSEKNWQAIFESLKTILEK